MSVANTEAYFDKTTNTAVKSVIVLFAVLQGILKGKYHCTVDLLFDWFGISCMTTNNFCFYLQNRLIQTSQTGGQWYSDTSPFSVLLWRKNSFITHQLGRAALLGTDDQDEPRHQVPKLELHSLHFGQFFFQLLMKPHFRKFLTI